MQQLIPHSSRLRLTFLAAVLLLIGSAFALPTCTFSTRHCGAIRIPDVSVQTANGITYIGGLGAVVAVRTTDGSQLWRTTVGDDASPIILDHGVLYVVAGARLTALRTRDGKPLWQIQGATSRVSPVVADGTVYIASSLAVSAVRTSDGQLLWTYTLKTANPSSLALDHQVLYVGSNRFTSALQQSSGKPLWTTQQPAFALTVRDAEVLTYSISTAAALRSGDGKRLWSFDLRTTSAANHSTITSSAAGIVYVNTSDTLYALRATDGQQLWHTQADGHMQPVIVGQVLYTLSSDGQPTALQVDDGTVLWKAASSVFAALVDVNSGVMYVQGWPSPGSQTPAAFALKLSDGSRLWIASEASGTPRLIANGVVYFSSWNISCDTPITGDVYAVHTGDGKDLWRVHLQ